MGYISPDLFTHSVSYFAEAPLRHHHPSAVHHIVYSCVPKADAKTGRLQAAVAAAGGEWREVMGLSEPALAQLIRQDRIDVLVELTGGGSWGLMLRWGGILGFNAEGGGPWWKPFMRL